MKKREKPIEKQKIVQRRDKKKTTLYTHRERIVKNLCGSRACRSSFNHNYVFSLIQTKKKVIKKEQKSLWKRKSHTKKKQEKKFCVKKQKMKRKAEKSNNKWKEKHGPSFITHVRWKNVKRISKQNYKHCEFST